jgi:predicted secreted protein
MSNEELARALGELERLLESCGEPDRAVWVRERRQVLEGDSADRKRSIRAEIGDALVGMGSIHDAYLDPLPGSGLTRDEVRERQNALVDRIDRALRSPA